MTEWNMSSDSYCSLQWRHNGHDGDCLLNRLFRRRWKKASKLRVTGFCEGNSTVTGEFPAQRASNAEKFPIWWRHHVGCDYRGTLSCSAVSATHLRIGRKSTGARPSNELQWLGFKIGHPDRIMVTRMLSLIFLFFQTRETNPRKEDDATSGRVETNNYPGYTGKPPMKWVSIEMSFGV